MLTSPVNVTIATSNGMASKPQATHAEPGPHKEPAPLPPVPPSTATIEPDLPSASPLTHLNAVAATAINRTVLQDLSINVAVLLKIARRPEETMTALFLRIIAAIEAMPQAERLQFEVRTGLKGQKITLSDLAMALRKPDGPEAARLIAIAEAPSAVPGRAAANAATTTYLAEGTADGHAEETLAMRAAARHSAAGQGVFTAENRIRPADSHPADAKVLQDQLKSMFEPGRATAAASADDASSPEVAALSTAEAAAETSAEAADAHPADTPPTPLRRPVPETADLKPLPGSGDGRVMLSTANLRLDPEAVEKIRSMAQAIAGETTEAGGPREDAGRTDTGDRRLQTMLTLKGLMEVVTALPAKAIEIIAGTPLLAEPPVGTAATEPADPKLRPLPVADPEGIDLPAAAADTTDETTTAARETTASSTAAFDDKEAEETDTATRRPGPAGHGTPSPAEDRATPDRPAALRPELLAQTAIPFGYAPVPPARDEVVDEVEEEEPQREAEDEADGESEEKGEKRRPRDEYDAIHDPVPEEKPAITINRDSSEADRAFALYQRMGGF
jgi:hypothetical protein